MARIALPSEGSKFSRETYGSEACARTSKPHCAVKSTGQSKYRTGSSMASVAMAASSKATYLCGLSGSVVVSVMT